MTVLETKAFDIMDHLGDAEGVMIFLADALETGDAAYLDHALSQIERSKGLASIAENMGMSGADLAADLATPGMRRFDTMFSMLKAHNFQIRIIPPPAQALAA